MRSGIQVVGVGRSQHRTTHPGLQFLAGLSAIQE